MAQKVRLVLSGQQWKRIEKLCVGKAEDPGGTGANNRMFVEAVLWIARTGSPWRDLLETFGKCDLRPKFHPAGSRIRSSFGPVRPGVATAWGAKPVVERSVPGCCGTEALRAA